MTMSFYLICFGVLGCYAGLRTVRAAWARGVIAIVLVGCLIHLGIRIFVPATPTPPDQVASMPIPAQSPITQPAPVTHGARAFFHSKLEAVQADRCVINHLRETPLSPLVYTLELHRFLEGYKRLQADQMKSGSMAGIGDLFGNTFGDTANVLSPAEQSAIQSGTQQGSLESLCGAFGKWTETLAQKSKPEQKRIWDSFQANIEHAQ